MTFQSLGDFHDATLKAVKILKNHVNVVSYSRKSIIFDFYCAS